MIFLVFHGRRDRARSIYNAFMRVPEHMIELFHGYTYSTHPLACAAGLAALDLYRDEKLFDRAAKLEPFLSDAAMSLKGMPGIPDVRTVGLAVGIDLAARPGAVRRRGYEVMKRAFHEENLIARVAGDTLAVAPPLIVTEAQIAEIFDKLRRAIAAAP